MANKVTLLGRVGSIETKSFENGKIVNLSIATDESYRDKEGNKVEATEWHKCVARGKQADTIEKFVNKGDLFYIEGKLKTRSWDNKGVKAYQTEIIINEFQFISKKSESKQIDSDPPF